MVKWMEHLMKDGNPSPLHEDAFAPSNRFAWVLGLLDLCYKLLKSSRDVFVITRTGFGESTFEFVGQFTTFFLGDLPLVWLQVPLITNDDKGHPISSLIFQVSRRLFSLGLNFSMARKP